MSEVVSGIHLVHKPIGPTSFSMVREYLSRAKEMKRPPRICHGGTLDPFASGLLLILVEPATKLFDYLHDIPKTYEATVRWGIETDNGDPYGAVISRNEPANLSENNLEEAIKSFVGWHEQIPHATSARRIDGERAYLKAHRGEAVEMPPAKVYLHEAHWISHELPTQSRLKIVARGGYYVRALARDLGRMLGCGAHLSELHRSAIGPWEDPGAGNTKELGGRELMPWLRTRMLSGYKLGEIRREGKIPVGEIHEPDWKLPEGFPAPRPMIRGMHLDKFCFLLREEGEELTTVVELGRGI